MVKRILLMLISILITLIITGCGNEGVGFQYSNGYSMKTFRTSPENNQCEPLVDFCESKGLKRSLTVSSAIYTEQMLPTHKVYCKYLCVSNETYEKMRQDPKFWMIQCTVPDEDFDFPSNMRHHISEDTIDFQIRYPKSRPVKFNRIEGEGDFSGEPHFLNAPNMPNEWDDEEGNHIVLYTGIINHKQGQEVTDGRIIFDYEVDGESKTFVSHCEVDK